MGKQEKRVLTLDRYEHGVVVNALNEMRNDLLEEERPTDIVDEVLLKVIDAPAKKVRCRSEDVYKRQSLDSSKARLPMIDPNGLSLKMLKICSPLIEGGTLRPFSVRWRCV